MALTMLEVTANGSESRKVETSIMERINRATDGQEVPFNVRYSDEECNATFIADDPDRLTIGQARAKLAAIRAVIKSGADLSAANRAVLLRGETDYARRVWNGLIQMRDAEMRNLDSALEHFKAGWSYKCSLRSKLITSAGKFSIDKGEPVLNFVVVATMAKDDSVILESLLAQHKPSDTVTVRKPAETVASK